MGFPQNTITIRAALAGEADFLGALALRSKAHWGYSRQFLEACRDELQYTAHQIVNSRYSFAVAEPDGAVVGFYAIERLSATEYELEALFVEPLYIGRGIGRALMDHAKRATQARGGEMLVIQSDPHAERFYLAAGALPTGQRESASIPGRYLPTLAIRLQEHTNHLDIPIIDVSGLASETGDRHEVAASIGHACREYGFFYIVGHGVDEDLQRRLEDASHEFFAQDLETKLKISMSNGGRAWRGYFPVGNELTSGQPDLKEGIYFGAELNNSHPLVQAGIPLHGPNLFPANPPQLRELVLDYMATMTRLGHVLMVGISLSLGLEASYFSDRYTADPLTLFRIFNYPAPALNPQTESGWGVGEHTDYGLLTILWQDASGGLQVKIKSQWIAAPPIPNSFVCNIGDMLDRITSGRYLSTPHRVRNLANHNRLSFAFFFDPNFNAEIKPMAINSDVRDNRAERWDHASVHEFQGTYGEYLLGKVSKVFPGLRREFL